MANGKEQEPRLGQESEIRGKQYGSDFRKQFLWSKAQEFAADLIELSREIPRDDSSSSIIRQLVRASASIAANIAEGYGRYSQAAYRNHLSIARGSAFETESWLDLLVRTGYLSSEVGEAHIARCVEIQKLVTARMKSLDSGKSYATKETGPEWDVE